MFHLYLFSCTACVWRVAVEIYLLNHSLSSALAGVPVQLHESCSVAVLYTKPSSRSVVALMTDRPTGSQNTFRNISEIQPTPVQSVVYVWPEFRDNPPTDFRLITPHKQTNGSNTDGPANVDSH